MYMVNMHTICLVLFCSICIYFSILKNVFHFQFIPTTLPNLLEKWLDLLHKDFSCGVAGPRQVRNEMAFDKRQGGLQGRLEGVEGG